MCYKSSVKIHGEIKHVNTKQTYRTTMYLMCFAIVCYQYSFKTMVLMCVVLWGVKIPCYGSVPFLLFCMPVRVYAFLLRLVRSYFLFVVDVLCYVFPVKFSLCQQRDEDRVETMRVLHVF